LVRSVMTHRVLTAYSIADAIYHYAIYPRSLFP
jgi:hypothetical protein